MANVWVPVGAGRWRLVDTGATAVASRQGAPFVRNERLSPKARKALKVQLGRDFDSESSLRAYMKDNDLRFIDPGDNQDKGRKRMAEFMRETKPGDPIRQHPPWVRRGGSRR